MLRKLHILRRSPGRNLLPILALAGLLTLALTSPACKPKGTVQIPAVKTVGGEIHGYVYAGISDTPNQQPPNKILLPDITVFVSSTSSSYKSSKVTTDLKGFFVISPQPVGTYTVCVEANGYASACPVTVQVTSETSYAHEVPIVPLGPAIFGRALVGKAGVPGNYDDPEIGVRFSTTLKPVDNGGVSAGPSARANVRGEYVLPSVKTAQGTVRADCEQADAKAGFTFITVPQQVNLTLNNEPPRNLIVSASQGGTLVRRVAGSSDVDLAASAQDAHPLTYHWRTSGAGEPFKPTNANKAHWTLPAGDSDSVAYVTAVDGHCGAIRQTLRVATGNAGLVFTGTVVDDGGNPVDKARVRLQGKEVLTNAEGGFMIEPVTVADRYALSIAKIGYKGTTEVSTAPVIGDVYRIDRVPGVPFDPVAGGTVIEVPRERKTQHQRRRAELTLPASALVQQDGTTPPAPGMGTAYLASIDLRDPAGRDFPGEYAGVNSSNAEVGLNSLGALDVQLVDSAGNRLQLKKNMTSKVRIPADPIQLGMPGMPAAPPAQAPVWFLDPDTGLWKEEGTADFDGTFYELKAPHFSTINIDLELNNPACMRIRTDLVTLRLPYQLRVSVPAAAPVKVKTGTISDELSVVVRLPVNTPIKLEVLDSAGAAIATATKTVNTGASSSPIFPTYAEYGTCTSEAVLTIPIPATSTDFLSYYGLSSAEDADTYYAKIDPTATSGTGTVSSTGPNVLGAGTTFTGFIQPGHILRAGGQTRLVAAVVSNTQLTTESAFSPALPAGTTWERVGSKPTLDLWKTANGFGADDADAVYLNAGDLNLGRWMHMKNLSGNQVAYYVSNYGIPPNNGSADVTALAKQTNNPSLGLIATVAMEYTPHPTINPTQPYTKFYVYNAAGNRVNKADLDGGGNKYLPNLCVICHGGNTSTIGTDARANGNARFIFFDTKSFGYSGLGAQFTENGQKGPFRELNRSVRDRTNVSPATAEVILGWYNNPPPAVPSPTLPNADLDGSFVPANWVPEASLYSDVVKPACRSCHATRDGAVSWSAWDGPNPNDGFKENSSIYNFVCNARLMPHAVITYNKFWLSTSPHMPNALADAGLDSWNSNSLCPTP